MDFLLDLDKAYGVSSLSARYTLSQTGVKQMLSFRKQAT